MSAPLTVLAVGASLGAGVAAAPLLGGVLSKPITGEVVPTRITDLIGYLTAKDDGKGPDGKPRALDQSGGFEDEESQTSIGTVDGSPIRPAPKPGTPAVPAVATSDTRRLLAAASLGSALLIAGVSFILIRRVMR